MDNGKNTTEITEVLETLIKVLTPNDCLICDSPGEVLCANCQEANLSRVVATCYGCKARSDDFSTCEKCRRNRPRPLNVWSYTYYEEHAKKLVYKMKFDSYRDAARCMAGLIDQIIPQIDFDVITYVPSSSRRIRVRGYDHTRLIAMELAKLRKIAMVKTLHRVDNTRQLGSTRAKRRQQAEQSYRAIESNKYNEILLIDDVISTGATIEACTKALRRYGHKKIYVASFARG